MIKIGIGVGHFRKFSPKEIQKYKDEYGVQIEGISNTLAVYNVSVPKTRQKDLIAFLRKITEENLGVVPTDKQLRSIFPEAFKD